MSYDSKTLSTFLSEVGSEAVTPAGGTCVAVVGAIGASLCEMTCVHTIGKDGYGDVEPELVSAADELASLRSQLLRLADSDARVVEDLLEATDEDRQGRMKRATGVPLTIAEASLAVLESAVVVTEKGSENARPDAGSGAFLVKAALQAAVFTVRTNIAYIDDPAFVETMEQRTAEIEAAAAELFEQIESNLAL
ncbi:cyclodeaminase/cyclohydrolase family protein [Haloarculaceae archaeon H-GB2-1]|nr:cyclodeaminase/cyclohydrolase family protein [Haloarculaceae archaeon H-GB1-1]MEA5406582.1 cyclodeaminase/cyclohydrolase family protein [Haloarculaceae archaeon H-GB2-1]